MLNIIFINIEEISKIVYFIVKNYKNNIFIIIKLIFYNVKMYLVLNLKLWIYLGILKINNKIKLLIYNCKINKYYWHNFNNFIGILKIKLKK